MLILTRKPGESLYIGDNVKVTVVEIKGHQIRIGIDAPSELRIYREEIYLQILEENKSAAEGFASGGLDNLAAAWSAKSSEQIKPKKTDSTSSMPQPMNIKTISAKNVGSPDIIKRTKTNKKEDL